MLQEGWRAAIERLDDDVRAAARFEQSAVVEQLQAYLGIFTTPGCADDEPQGDARAQVAAQQAEIRQYYDGLKLTVAGYFGAKEPAACTVRACARRRLPGPSTSTQLAVKAAKAMATRVLRGTTSKKKKALVKSGPMQFLVGPVQQAALGSAPEGSTAASTASAVAVNAASPPAASK